MILGLELSGCGGGASTAATSTALASAADVDVATAAAAAGSSETAVDAAATVSAKDAITGVFTTGFVDVDGAKVQAVAVKYNLELKGANVGSKTFKVWNYALGQSVQLGSNPGAVKSVYIDDEPYDTDGKTGSGNYVVITLNTDYQLAAVPAYKTSMAAAVVQTASFTTAAGTAVNASASEFTNYTLVTSTNMQGVSTVTQTAIPAQFDITNVRSFKRFTNDAASVLGYTPDGPAFQATNCFDEIDGLLHDVALPYALYVPADYDATRKYMLVLHVEDAGALGTDPNITLTEAKANANYASAEVQQLAKDQGYAGLIVVAPQISSALRSTRDNYSLSAAVPATWQLLDYLTAKYNVDTDRIFASGQSMGGMQVIAMAAQRDNYFAGVWPIGSQWGNNFNLNVPYSGAAYYPSTDATIWTKDAHGNPVNNRNWYYLISDDNILINNALGDLFSPTIWAEAAALYKDVTGGAIDIKGNRYTQFDPLTTSLDAQNAAVKALAAKSSTANFGIMWEAYNGGSHFLSWVYAHRIFANYQWLLSQTRQSEMNRQKLALDKPVVYAPVQLKDADHLIFSGQNYYYKTFAVGSGTEGYNTTFANPNGAIIRLPGWIPADFGY